MKPEEVKENEKGKETFDSATLQNPSTRSHGSPFYLPFSSSRWDLCFSSSPSSSSRVTWVVIILKPLASYFLESLLSFLVSMRPGLHIIPGGVQQDIDLLPFLTIRSLKKLYNISVSNCCVCSWYLDSELDLRTVAVKCICL